MANPDLSITRKALEAIVIRCREGDKRSDWLPIIDRLATEALAALPPNDPSVVVERVRALLETWARGTSTSEWRLSDLRRALDDPT